MKQIMLALIAVCFTCTVAAQAKAADIAKIKTRQQAETFLDAHSDYDGDLYDISSGEDAGEILSPLFAHKPGYTFNIGSYQYKLIELDSALSFRVSYIYLDGSKFTKQAADSLRKQIIARYKAGEDFAKLVSEYNMDSNPTGDSNWFTENMMVQEFEAAVRAHKKGDILL